MYHSYQTYLVIFYQTYLRIGTKGVNFIKNLFVSGYRSYELGIFSNEDDKLFFIKEHLKKRLKDYIESGVEWIIISGQLGIELWCGEVVFELKEDYPTVKLGVLLPHLGFGDNWNELNQQLFQTVLEKADYVNHTSNQEYKHPGQLKGNQQFIMDHTGGALLVYDEEGGGKPGYLYNQIIKYQENSTYELEVINFDELQDFVTEYEEMYLKD